MKKIPWVYILALEKIKEIIPFSNDSPPHLVLAQNTRSQKFLHLQLSFLSAKNKSLKKKRKPVTTDYLKPSNIEVMLFI